MPIFLRQSTASQEIPLGFFVDSTDGNTEETGLTIANTDIKIWKTGATTLANKNSGGATHIANGLYYAVLDATDTDTIGPAVIYCHPSGALATRTEVVVLDEAVYDVLFGTTALATTTNITAGTITTATNVTTVNGLAANVITATAINADAITAAKVASDVSAEIADAVWEEAQADHVAAGSFGVTASEIADILVDTAEIGAAGAGLTNINLPDQAMNITGNITGNLSGSVGSVTGAVASVTGNVGGNVVGSVGSVTGLTAANLDTTVSSRATPAQVNTEVVDALNTDTYAEPGQGAPGATVSLVQKIGYLYKAWRNKSTQTSTTYQLYGDDATTVDQKATVSDDATTFTKGETATGP